MKLIYAILFEKLHRFVFDTYYQQDYKIKGIDRVVLLLYHSGFKILPTWRQVLIKYFGKCSRYLRYYYALVGYVQELNRQL